MPAVSVEADKREGAFTPCEYRAKEGQDVFKRIITQLDQKLDKATMGEIMESCGRLCYDGANPNPQRATPEEASRFMEGMRDHLGKDGVQFKFQKNRIRLVKSQLII